MKVLIAIDSFKGSLNSIELSTEIEKGIQKVFPDAEILKIPIADGGEGTIDSLINENNGTIRYVEVNDPLMRKITAKYGVMNNGTAIIELAQASGLTLLTEGERNPLKTTTFGTGEIIKDAILKGYRKFILGIGGSATNDGGIGILKALGYRFFDSSENELSGTGESLSKIMRIDSSNVLKELKDCEFLIACDVTNTLYGSNGATRVFAKQKGASEEMIETLDMGLKHFSDILEKEFKKNISQIKGSGAAGGVGGGLMAFFNAKILQGIDIILHQLNLEKILKDVDFVITGEGKLDNQSVMGKTPIGIAKIAKKFDIPVIALAGGVTDEASKTHLEGIDSYFSIINYPITLEEAMKKENSKKFIRQNTEEIFRLIKVCQIKYSK